MTFWYHMSGAHVGSLSIKLEYLNQEGFGQMLWTAGDSERPDDNWREARVLLHKSLKQYRVVIEGTIGKGSSGGIAVDDIIIANHILPEQCKGRLLNTG
ncbi:hypothetical protein AB205_0110720 [Aquarana catesbeiana]|uniref:MAM domain-containing protein n=1 Tax=Aquarana catesbeiana TaxID=8400 RepID=A0A2G9QGS8_AQUCT|nr:hypothetical protein AB205_0110720 [Aquarana catesbeiana]